MTDQLEGPALALKVAEVMKRSHSVYDYDGELMCSVSNRPWRPDLGGAAAWEVLEWANQNEWIGDVAFTHDNYHHLPRVDFFMTGCVPTVITRGDTHAIALCRAVVKLGETT